ncbi:MAG: hypothetical protein PF505_02170 [Vallitaleaceae bacterium]|jgi:hypothetical protein|nr:hypothetical protein [Vallitaleaceae bacterium]
MNQFGWSNEPVRVGFFATDALYPIVFISDSLSIDSEGTNQSVNCVVENSIGMISTLTANGINIDRTAPRVSITSKYEVI